MGRSRLDAESNDGTSTAFAALIPVDPGMAIDDVVARMRAAGASHVELLVPNETRSLQSVAACELLGLAAAEAGIQVTLFTADERTLAAAKVAKLDTVPVDSTIVVPEGATPAVTPGVASLVSPRLAPDPRSTIGPPVDPTLPSSLPVSDQDFLASLRAFDQSLVPPAPADGDTLPTAEGAVLFDAPGDRGVHRPPLPEGQPAREAWESAFDEMGTTMGAEPIPPPRGAAPRPRPASELPPRTQRASPGAQSLIGSFGRAMPGRRQPAKAGGTSGPSRFGTSIPDTGSTSPESQLSRRLPVWPLALASLLVLGVAGWLLLPLLDIGFGRAELALTPAIPPAEVQQFPGLTIPLSETPIADQSSYAIQGAILREPVRVTVQGEAISTTTAPIGLASGVLILRNTLSQPLLLRAGTVVPAANGVQFTVDSDVTVPAAAASEDGITFGRGQVSLTATVPGAAGNIAPGSITAIPGYEGTLRVEQGAFAGGSDQEVQIVRVEDVNRELPRAVSQLYEAGVQALGAAATSRQGLSLVTGAIRPTVESLQSLDGVEYAVFPPIGGVATEGTFTLEVRATFAGVAQPDPTTYEAEITRAARNLLVNTHDVAPDSRVEVSGWSVGEQGFVVDAVVHPAGVAPPLDEALLAEVESRLAGLPETEARAYLDSLVQEGKIGGYSDLPLESGSIPTRLDVRQAES